jgi:CHAD domain-containing protein
MALDVPTTAYTLPDRLDPSALLDLLRRRFDIEAEAPVRRTFTVIDTADRRVRDAGGDLVLEPDRPAPALVLRPQPGAATVRAEVARSRRWLVDELPEGALRDHLGPVVEMRALLPLAKVQADVQTLHVRNADEKTVVRLRVATHAALDTGGRPVPLAARVEVTGVLGYPKPRERVVDVLTGKAGLRDAPASMADEAIAAAGGDPAGIRSKPRIELRPGQRTDRAAVAVLDDLADIVEANMPGTLADLDTEFLHDLRVAVRRSRSVLRELKKAFPPGPLEVQRDALKWVQAVTGPARDLDVQLLDWDALAAELPPERLEALVPVRELLVKRRAAALRVLKRELRGANFRQAWTGYRAFLAGDLGPARDRPDAKRPLDEVAGRRIRKVYATMVDLGSAIDADSPAHDLHELRKRGKELRYLLELFGALWPRDTVKPMVTSLKGLQDVLGHHQDAEVQAAQLRELAVELAGEAGGPDALLALGVLVDRLGEAQHQARDGFAERFAAFAAPERRKLVKGTFRGRG